MAELNTTTVTAEGINKKNNEGSNSGSGWFSWMSKNKNKEAKQENKIVHTSLQVPEPTQSASVASNSGGSSPIVPERLSSSTPNLGTAGSTNPSKKKRSNYHTVPGLYHKRKLSKKEAKARLKLIKNYAKWLDAIPGLPISIGLDGIVGLIPGVGDLATGILSLMLIYLARDFDLPTSTKMKMLTNVGFDTLVGTVPLFGDIFDVMFKANLKNVEILEKWFNKNQHMFSDDDDEIEAV